MVEFMRRGGHTRARSPLAIDVPLCVFSCWEVACSELVSHAVENGARRKFAIYGYLETGTYCSASS